MSALTPEEIRDNERRAEQIKSQPWFTPESQNPHPFGSTKRHDLEERIKK